MSPAQQAAEERAASPGPAVEATALPSALSLALLEVVAQGSPNAIIVKDLQGKLLFANATALASLPQAGAAGVAGLASPQASSAEPGEAGHERRRGDADRRASGNPAGEVAEQI